MELEINGIRADLGESKIAISRRTIDINNPTVRFLDITNQFVLPDTQINRQIFSSPRAVNSNNDSFEYKYRAKVIDQFYIFNGYGQLTDSADNTFKFQLIDESKKLFDGLKVKLNTVSWHDKDIQLNQTTLDTLDVLDSDTCWIWPAVCCHKDRFIANTSLTTGDNRVLYSRPSFYLAGLLKRAIALQGYTWTPEPTAIESLLAMSANEKDFLFSRYEKVFNGDIIVSGTYQLTGLTTYEFNHDFTPAIDYITVGSLVHRWRFRGNIATSGALKFRTVISSPIADDEIQEFTINQDQTEINFLTGDFVRDHLGSSIRFYLVGNATITFYDTKLYSLCSENHETVELETNPFLDYHIKAYDNFPDITYMDLLRTICILSNSIPIVNNMEKTIRFQSLSVMQKMRARNWSAKFIRNSENITGKFSNLARQNILMYSNDPTIPLEYGEYIFNINSEVLPDELEYIKMPFSAGTDVDINGNVITFMECYYENGSGNNYRIKDKDRELKIRLYYLEGTEPILAQFDPINFKNIAANYYAGLFNSLYRIRQIDCQMNLTKLDVLGWNLLDLIYIDHFKSHFIILEIADFISGRPTSVKLLKYG